MNDTMNNALIQPPTLESILAAAVFIGLRVSGLLLFAPGLSNNAVPARTKAAFVVVLVVLLWPVVPVPPMHVSPLEWTGIALNELLIGIIVGLLLNFIFDAAQFAGQILGMQMGFSLATMIDPQSQADSAVLSIFYQTIVLLIFFALDVHHWVLRALVSSFYYLPAGHFILTCRTRRERPAYRRRHLGPRIADRRACAHRHGDCRFCIGLYRESVAATTRTLHRHLG